MTIIDYYISFMLLPYLSLHFVFKTEFPSAGPKEEFPCKVLFVELSRNISTWIFLLKWPNLFPLSQYKASNALSFLPKLSCPISTILFQPNIPQPLQGTPEISGGYFGSSQILLAILSLCEIRTFVELSLEKWHVCTINL